MNDRTRKFNRIGGLVKLYFTKPRLFVSHHLSKNAPSLLIVAWIVGIGGVIKKFPTDTNVLNAVSWTSLWVQFLLWGAVGGIVTYYIVGTLNYFVQKWAKGTADKYVSRNITIYALLPLSILLIGALSANMVIFGDDYLTDRGSVLDTVLFPFGLLALAWTAYFTYAGFRCYGMRKVVALLYFIVLPTVFYASAMLVGLSFMKSAL